MAKSIKGSCKGGSIVANSIRRMNAAPSTQPTTESKKNLTTEDRLRKRSNITHTCVMCAAVSGMDMPNTQEIDVSSSRNLTKEKRIETTSQNSWQKKIHHTNKTNGKK